MGGGALGSGCVSKLGSKEVSKIKIAQQMRDDMYRHAELVLATQTETVFSRFTSHFSRKRVAFTLAEVLITLGIIGVVAALTLPSVIQNYRKRVIESKLEKTYSILSQAYARSVDENGDFSQLVFTGAKAGKDYYNTYWKKYLKTAWECGSELYVYDRGEYPWFRADGYREGTSVRCAPRTRWIVTLPDGVLLLFLIYTETSTPKPVKLIFVDINGLAKPNTLGKDIFIFTYDEHRIKPFEDNVSDNDFKKECKAHGSACATLIIRNGWKIPKDYPVRL